MAEAGSPISGYRHAVDLSQHAAIGQVSGSATVTGEKITPELFRRNPWKHTSTGIRSGFAF